MAIVYIAKLGIRVGIALKFNVTVYVSFCLAHKQLSKQPVVSVRTIILTIPLHINH